jgi:hypothetical protein
MTHNYERHGTTSLFAALYVKTGQVIGDIIGDIVVPSSGSS